MIAYNHKTNHHDCHIV